ncbi:MAG: dienelactone hydrolase family protein, partial [Deltaproteobacteria bacterium]
YAEKFGIPVGYDPDADRKSWEEMKRFFSRVFGNL